MAKIADFFSTGRNVAGQANAIREFLPSEIANGIDSILGGNILPLGQRKGISGFRSTINNLGGLQRSNQFYVTIPNPRILQGDIGPITLPFLTESAVLPGVSLATSEIRRYGYGPTEKKPYAPVFTDQQMTFLGDGSGVVHKFFYKWMNGIIKYDEFPRGRPGYNNVRPFEVEFKRNYAVDITISCIDEIEKKIIEVTLYDAFPIFVGDVALNWADNDSFVRFPVTFTYYKWKRTDININIDDLLGEDISPIQRILKAGTAIQTLARIKKPQNINDITNVVNNSKTAIGSVGGLF
jgi:hypothetical protein